MIGLMTSAAVLAGSVSAAFPVIRDTTGVEQGGVGSNPLPMAYPAGIQAGDYLLLVVVVFGSTSVSTPAGWTSIPAISVTNRLYAFYKVAAGTETGNFNIATGVYSSMKAICVAVSGAAQLDYAVNDQTAGGAGSTVDPPSLSPSWGLANTLFVAYATNDQGSATVSSYPSGYGLGHFLQDTNDSADGMAVAAKNVAAATEDPGVFTWDAGIPIKRIGITFALAA